MRFFWNGLTGALAGRGRPGFDSGVGEEPGKGPVLTIPTAAEIAARRASELAEWQARASRLDAPPPRTTRKEVEAILRARGYRSRRGDGETVFVRSLQGLLICVLPKLRSFAETDLTAPRQRLRLTAWAATEPFASAWSEITGGGELPHMLGADTPEARDFFLTATDVEELIVTAETRLTTADPVARLREFAAYDPGRPGNAGLLHLTALATTGEADKLASYLSQRREGGNAGFVPFITDDMIRRAHAIARTHPGD